jgi:hypothetical protein
MRQRPEYGSPLKESTPTSNSFGKFIRLARRVIFAAAGKGTSFYGRNLIISGTQAENGEGTGIYCFGKDSHGTEVDYLYRRALSSRR